MLEITFRELECFTAAAETGSVSKAAEKLHLTQSTVSTHIASLEEALGKRLIFRGPRKKTELTPEGADIYKKAQDILTRCALLAPTREEEKIISIAVSTIPAQYLLPPLMTGFAAKHPGTVFSVRRGDSGDVASALENGEARIGVLGTKKTGAPLKYIRIAEDELVLVTPATAEFSALKNKENAYKDILKKYPLIRREENSGTQREADALLRKAGVNPASLKAAVKVDSPELAVAYAASGMGVAVVSRLSAENEEKAGRLLMFPLPSDGKGRSFYLAFRRDSVLYGTEKLFAEYLKNKLTTDIISKKTI